MRNAIKLLNNEKTGVCYYNLLVVERRSIQSLWVGINSKYTRRSVGKFCDEI